MAVRIADCGLRIADYSRAHFPRFLAIIFICVFNQSCPAQNAIEASSQIKSQVLRNPKSEIRNPLFWADGITSIDQLEAYKRAGFNTVIVRLTWPPSQGGQIAPADLLPQHTFAAAAAGRGLNIIYALPATPFGGERAFPISGEVGPYRMLWTGWVQHAISRLQGTPNLIGWMLPDDPRGLPLVNRASFLRWLGENYLNVQVLNKQWATTFGSLEEVTPAAARAIIERWRGPGPLPGLASDVEMRNYIVRAQKRPANQNFAFHPAELALAQYKWDSYRALLDFWAQTIRAADGPRRIFSGRLPDYAQLLSLPPSVDVSVPSLAPEWAEKDIGTHNPQAVAVARRSGRFAAIPVLSTRLSEAPEGLISQLVPSWCDVMLGVGAQGIAFDSWPDIAQNNNLRRAVRASLRRLQSEQYSGLWGQSPQATAAVILTPLADGYTWHPPIAAPDSGALPTLGSVQAKANENVSPPRGLFGFGEDMVRGEPSDLVYALRWGTLFGNIDYLSPDELGDGYSAMSNGVLRRYSVVLLPQALYVSPAMAQELANYLAGGGTAVADIGLGAAQNGGQVLGLSESLTSIFGVLPTELQTLAFNLQGTATHPLLPSWSALASTKPQAMTRGDGPQGAAFAGPLLMGELAPGTMPLALAFQLPQAIGNRGPAAAGSDRPNANTPRLRMLRSWLTLRPFGAGNALFAPFRLWNLWRPGYPGFDAFHGDLLSRGAQISHLNTESLVPAPAGTPEGNALYPEAINFQNAIAVINHNAAPNPTYTWFDAGDSSPTSGAPPAKEDSVRGETVSPAGTGNLASQLKEFNSALTSNPAQPAIVQTAGVEQFVWSNALCLFPVGGSPSPTLGRHPPVANYGAVAGDANFIVPPTAHPVILHTFVPAQEMRVMRLLPIRALSPTGSSLACRVREYSPQHIELRVWPNAQSAKPSLGGDDWSVTLGSEGVVRLVVFDLGKDSTYRVLPHSKHRIAITEITSDGKSRTASTRNYVLLADRQGSLPFEVKGTSLRIEISPLDSPSTPSGNPDTVTDDSTPLTPAIVPDNSPAITPDTSPAITPDITPGIIPDPKPEQPIIPMAEDAPPAAPETEPVQQDEAPPAPEPEPLDPEAEEHEPMPDPNNPPLFHKRYHR